MHLRTTAGFTPTEEGKKIMKDYFRRVVTGEHVRRGAASAVAGLVVGIIVEALWPTA